MNATALVEHVKDKTADRVSGRSGHGESIPNPNDQSIGGCPRFFAKDQSFGGCPCFFAPEMLHALSSINDSSCFGQLVLRLVDNNFALRPPAAPSAWHMS